MKDKGEERTKTEAMESQANVFVSRVDEEIASRIERIASEQAKELEMARRDVSIAEALFELEARRTLEEENGKCVRRLADAYRNLDLGK